MKRFLCLLACPALLMGSRTAHAQTPPPLGSIAATYSIDATKLLADPARDRIYALLPTSNTVLVIDTETLQTTDVTVGSVPVDMALSPDGNTLYTANSGSTVSAVSAVDLNTLTTSGTALSLPAPAEVIAAGPQGRVYVFLNNSATFEQSNSPTLYQLDTTTGNISTPFSGNYAAPLQVSPDGKTLFVVNSSGELVTFDVSTATPMALATSTINSNGTRSYIDALLVISHNGQYFAGISYLNSSDSIYNTTPLFSTADLTSVYGSFINGNSAGALAFSPDDSLVYQLRSASGEQVIDLFSTQTFAQVQESSPFPIVPTSAALYQNFTAPYFESTGSVVVDRTSSYVFLNGDYETYYGPSGYGSTTVGRVVAVTTGTGTLTPTSILPAITSVLSATGTVGTPFTYQITASNSPTSYAATGLPAGLSVDPTTGLISGTPTTTLTGSASPIISATNASGTITAYLGIVITAGPAPVITSAATATAIVGQPFSYQITATGSPTSFAALGLPPGLDVTTSGLIFGTPTATGTTFPLLVANYAKGGTSGTLTLTVTAALPTVEIMAVVPTVTPESGDAGEFVLERTGDLSQPLLVSYSLHGNTHNGTDYQLLSGTQKIKAGRASAVIEILPKGTRYSIPRTVRMQLEPAASYQVGTPSHAKVTIEPIPVP